MHSGATGHPYADFGKLGAEFLATWVAQTPYSGFLRGLHRSISNQKHWKLSRQKRKLVQKENPNDKEWIRGFDGIKIPLFETLENGDIKPFSTDKIKAIVQWKEQ